MSKDKLWPTRQNHDFVTPLHHPLLLEEEALLGESRAERMARFGLICENAYGNWDLTDRDLNALRTAEACLLDLGKKNKALHAKVRELEQLLEPFRV